MNTSISTKQAAERILIIFSSAPDEFDFVQTVTADDLLKVMPHEAEVIFHLLNINQRQVTA